MILYDYRCTSKLCGYMHESLEHYEIREKPCPECGAPAIRAMPAPKVRTVYGAAVSYGGREAPPHPGMMDTRSLAEGESYSSWKARRQKARSEETKRRNGVEPKVYIHGK